MGYRLRCLFEVLIAALSQHIEEQARALARIDQVLPAGSEGTRGKKGRRIVALFPFIGHRHKAPELLGGPTGVA
ncbi:MAG: hypothetical protein ACREX4_11915 [Gammaproteobacteria bacterium]